MLRASTIQQQIPGSVGYAKFQFQKQTISLQVTREGIKEATVEDRSFKDNRLIVMTQVRGAPGFKALSHHCLILYRIIQVMQSFWEPVFPPGKENISLRRLLRVINKGHMEKAYKSIWLIVSIQ